MRRLHETDLPVRYGSHTNRGEECGHPADVHGLLRGIWIGQEGHRKVQCHVRRGNTVESFRRVVANGKPGDLKSPVPHGTWGFKSLTLRCGEVAEWLKAAAC